MVRGSALPPPSIARENSCSASHSLFGISAENEWTPESAPVTISSVWQCCGIAAQFDGEVTDEETTSHVGETRRTRPFCACWLHPTGECGDLAGATSAGRTWDGSGVVLQAVGSDGGQCL